MIISKKQHLIFMLFFSCFKDLFGMLKPKASPRPSTCQDSPIYRKTNNTINRLQEKTRELIEKSKGIVSIGASFFDALDESISKKDFKSNAEFIKYFLQEVCKPTINWNVPGFTQHQVQAKFFYCCGKYLKHLYASGDNNTNHLIASLKCNKKSKQIIERNNLKNDVVKGELFSELYSKAEYNIFNLSKAIADRLEI